LARGVEGHRLLWWFGDKVKGLGGRMVEMGGVGGYIFPFVRQGDKGKGV
jgi:hypothetical protein